MGPDFGELAASEAAEVFGPLLLPGFFISQNRTGRWPACDRISQPSTSVSLVNTYSLFKASKPPPPRSRKPGRIRLHPLGSTLLLTLRNTGT
jgi:hypothetical protein